MQHMAGLGRHMAADNQIGGVSRVRPGPDAVVKAVHGVLALALLGAWLTAGWDGLRDWHLAFGHAAAGGLLLRIAWSLACPRASLMRWWRTLLGMWRRMRHGHTGPLGLAAWSLAGLSGLVCVILVMVPWSFLTGWLLAWWGPFPPGELVSWHVRSGQVLMGAVACHLALIVVLGVWRGRCMVCEMLPWRRSRSVGSIHQGR